MVLKSLYYILLTFILSPSRARVFAGIRLLSVPLKWCRRGMVCELYGNVISTTLQPPVVIPGVKYTPEKWFTAAEIRPGKL